MEECRIVRVTSCLYVFLPLTGRKEGTPEGVHSEPCRLIYANNQKHHARTGDAIKFGSMGDVRVPLCKLEFDYFEGEPPRSRHSADSRLV